MNRFKLCLALGLAALLAPAASAQTAEAPAHEAREGSAGAHFLWMDYSASDPAAAAFPVGKDEYRTDILPGFHPDPSIVRVGEDYYLVNSTFAWFPGLPIYHSRDLVNWTQIGNAIDRPDQLSFAGLGISRGVFAPTIRWHDGLFYILNTCIDCGGNYMITAADPAGPYSDPVWLPGVDGIDPDIFFDDDGRTWITNNAEPNYPALYEGHRAIWMQQFDLASQEMVGPRRMIVDGGVNLADKPIWAEGPHILKRNGYYYLLTAEGGTAGDHAATIYRSDNVEGPYVPGPVNPILTQRDLDPGRPFPIYATGHADLVQLPDGDDWAVFLGTRPYRDNLSNMGRETFLLPVQWGADGWPVILPAKTAVPHVAALPALPRQAGQPPIEPSRWHDPFDRSALGPQWLSSRGSADSFVDLGAMKGALTLAPLSVSLGSLDTPAFVGRRQSQQNAVMTTRLDFGDLSDGQSAGLAAFSDEHHFVFVKVVKAADGNRLTAGIRDGEKDPERGRVLAEAPIADQPVDLRITLEGPTALLAYRTGTAAWRQLGKPIDAAALASERSNMFTGIVLGAFAEAAEPE